MNLKDTSWVRNLLVTLGAFWLSLQVVVLFAWLFGRLNNRVIYGDGVLDAIAMGVMTSLGRDVAAALAAALVTLSAASQKPERWAFIVAILAGVRQEIRPVAHGLHTTRDDDGAVAGFDCLRRECDSFQPEPHTLLIVMAPTSGASPPNRCLPRRVLTEPGRDDVAHDALVNLLRL